MTNSINNLKVSELADVQKLVFQLTKKRLKTNWSSLKKVMQNEILLIARDRKKVIGLTVLSETWKPTAYAGTIEDMIVDEKYRGQGIGKKMLFLAIRKARKLKMTYLNLTTNASRIEANSLYQKIGFKVRETNAYKLDL